jgi:uncharacterized protein YfkK (UPF0435 family)
MIAIDIYYYPIDFLTCTYPGVKPDDFTFVFVADLVKEKIIQIYSCKLESDEFYYDNFYLLNKKLDASLLHPVDILLMEKMELKYLYQLVFSKDEFTPDVLCYLTETKNIRENN